MTDGSKIMIFTAFLVGFAICRIFFFLHLKFVTVASLATVAALNSGYCRVLGSIFIFLELTPGVCTLRSEEGGLRPFRQFLDLDEF